MRRVSPVPSGRGVEPSILLLLLLVCLCMSCATSESRDRPLPIRFATEIAKEEQLEVLEQYGAPQRAWRRPLGVTRWLYCDGVEEPLIIEFDHMGQVLAMTRSVETKYCSNGQK